MKLTSLAPKWWTGKNAEGKDQRYGISLACPVHAHNGIDPETGFAQGCSSGRLTIGTEPGSRPDPWQRQGDDFATMTLQPSVKWSNITPEGKLGSTHWHGHITSGEVSILPDSKGDAA